MTFDEWWKDAWMEEQNFKDIDTLEYSYAFIAWEYQQKEIDRLNSYIMSIFSYSVNKIKDK